MALDPADTTLEWADPLYRPLLRLPYRGTAQRFGSIEAEVNVTDTGAATVQAQWLPDRVIGLIVDDRAPAAELSRALPSFRAYAAALGSRPATAMLTLPSRDVDRCRVAREQGFAPYSVLAVCPLPRPGVVPGALPAGVRIRTAGPADAEGVTALWRVQAEYEARIGTLRFSPAIGEAMRRAVPEALAGPGRVIVAELGERLVGVVMSDPAAASLWAGARVRATTAGYLSLACTAPGERGRGIGGALVRERHRRLSAAGVEVDVLHYSAYNPLAIPFWSQHGYRPLLTTFACPL
jgi:GNAT superfamily N-acetyltransferase